MWGGAERWSTGFFLGDEGANASDPTQDAADALAALFRTAFTHVDARVSNNYTFLDVKLSYINASGETDNAKTIYGYPATAATGAKSSEHLPSQCAVVLTLLSDRPRGKASKGRMYLPGFTYNMPSTGKISSTDTNSMANVWKTFFDGVRANFTMPGTPILAAKGTGAFPALTAQNDYVETIRIGDVVDTQRRRRNGLTETYVSRTLT